MNTVVQLRPSPSEKPTVRSGRAKNTDYRQREYLTEAEIDKLMAGESRNPGRDRLLILMAFRHALRVSELVDLRWQQVHLDTATVDIRRAKTGTPGIHGLQGDELRLLRALRREHPHADFVFLSERKAPLSVDGAQKLIERLGVAAKLRFPIHAHMLRYAAAGDGPRGVPGARCVTVALARLLVHLSAFFAHRPIMLPTRTIMAPTNACH
jgi:integrase